MVVLLEVSPILLYRSCQALSGWMGSVSATTMLHRRDGARFPPDAMLGIQVKEFNLGFIRPENLVSHGLRVL